MKIKILSLLTFVFISLTQANAQEVKFSKGDVLVDDVKKFEYEKKALGNQFSLYTPGRESEIVFIKFNNNETAKYIEDDFLQITFIKDQKKIETMAFKGRNNKWIIEKLLNDKVLDLQGNIDSEKLEAFYVKYDENITNRTIRN